MDCDSFNSCVIQIINYIEKLSEKYKIECPVPDDDRQKVRLFGSDLDTLLPLFSDRITTHLSNGGKKMGSFIRESDYNGLIKLFNIPSNKDTLDKLYISINETEKSQFWKMIREILKRAANYIK